MDIQKLDAKNIALGKLVYALRQSLDVHRVINLNIESLQALKPEVSEPFFAYVLGHALESVAIGICKIFERAKRNELNSIHGVVTALSNHAFTRAQVASVARFGAKYGNPGTCEDVRDYLEATLEGFLAAHKEALLKLRRFRDKAGAHSETGFELESLASHDEFEALFDYANDFYRLVGDAILGIGPSPMAPHVETSLLKCLRRLGIEAPARQFPKARKRPG